MERWWQTLFKCKCQIFVEKLDDQYSLANQQSFEA